MQQGWRRRRQDWQRAWHALWLPRRTPTAHWSDWAGVAAGLLALLVCLLLWRRSLLNPVLLVVVLAGLLGAVPNVLPRAWWRLAGLLRLANRLLIVAGIGYAVWFLTRLPRS
jgi:hypothetical protein